MSERVQYDEFSMFGENISEYSIDASPTPVVKRVLAKLSDGRTMSALQWGAGGHAAQDDIAQRVAAGCGETGGGIVRTAGGSGSCSCRDICAAGSVGGALSCRIIRICC